MLSLVYTRDDAGNLTYAKNIPEPDYKSKVCYTGKSIVSMFIPEGLIVTGKTQQAHPFLFVTDNCYMEP